MQGVGFCLAIQPADEDIGIIGRKYATLSGCKMCSLIHSAKTPSSPHAHTRKKEEIFLLFFTCSKIYCYNAENFMTGYRTVFDRENLKLAWSRSNCEFSFLSIDIKEGSNLPSVMWFASGGSYAMYWKLEPVISLGIKMPTASCLPCLKYSFVFYLGDSLNWLSCLNRLN